MNTKVLSMSAAAVMLAGCVCDKNDACKCPCGSWAMYLPYESMNAGHLILEKNADGKYEGTLLWRWGSPFKVEQVTASEGKFTLEFGDHKPKDLPPEKFAALRRTRVEATVCGDEAKCVYKLIDGNGKIVDGPKNFVAKRNPPIGLAPDIAAQKWGEPINLLAGSKDDFEMMEPKVDGWTLKDGVLSNRILRDKDGKWAHKNGNLRTKRADFMDFKLSYDVRVPKGCNSGVYLRGIYELQVLDSYGQPLDCHNMAACYGRLTPRVSAEKPAGEWQHVDVILLKRHLTVVLNGVNIYDNVAIPGITGGAMTPDEFAPGPIYLQGDHSDADYKNMILTPAL